MTADQTIPTILSPIMDMVTSEAIAYGSSYQLKKSLDYIWDMMDSAEDEELKKLYRKLHDPYLTMEMLKRYDYSPTLYNAIASGAIKFNEPWKNEDMVTLREIIKVHSGKKAIKVKRKDNEMYCRMVANDEYAQSLRERGLTEDAWRTATIDNPEPIGYDAVRALIDDDEAKAETYATWLDQQIRLDEYRRKVALRRQEEAENPPEIDIYKEKIDPNSDEYWNDEIPIYEEQTEAIEEEENDDAGYVAEIEPWTDCLEFSVFKHLMSKWPIDPVTGMMAGVV